MILTLFKLWSN